LHEQCTVLYSGIPISQGNAEALDRWGGKTKHRMISYFLSDTSAKNYRNPIMYVKIYSKSKVGRFLRHGVDYLLTAIRDILLARYFPKFQCA